MVRAAAKNFHRVAVLTDPSDYAALLAELAQDGTLGLPTRFAPGAKAFRLTARTTPRAIAEYLLRASRPLKTGGDAANTGACADGGG